MASFAVILVSVLFAAFFSGMDEVLVSAGKLRPKANIKSSHFRTRLLRTLTTNPGYYHVSTLIGYTLAMVTFGIATAGISEHLTENHFIPAWFVTTCSIIIAAFVMFSFGFLLPKSCPKFFSHSYLMFLSVPLGFIYRILYPATWLMMMFTRMILQIFTDEMTGKDTWNKVFLNVNTGHLVKKEEPTLATDENEVDREVFLIRNALDFSKVKLYEIMVPRNEIAVLDITSDVETLKKKFVETGFSRILFFENNTDNIVGYVHTSAIFQKAKQIKPFLKSVLIVPETMAANRLLSRFIHEHRSIALVVDEFGGTAGLVTIEDILEEIFGEIEDEYDTIDFKGKKINDKQYILSGRFEIDALNEKYKLNIPESNDYETLAGYILCYYESIPRVNTVIRIGRMNFKILKSTLTKIEMVQLTILED